MKSVMTRVRTPPGAQLKTNVKNFFSPESKINVLRTRLTVCPNPPPVCIRKHYNDYVRTLKILVQTLDSVLRYDGVRIPNPSVTISLTFTPPPLPPPPSPHLTPVSWVVDSVYSPSSGLKRNTEVTCGTGVLTCKSPRKREDVCNHGNILQPFQRFPWEKHAPL